MHERPRTHDAGLQTDVERGPGQTVVAEAPPRVPKRDDLCVGGRVLVRDRPIPSLADRLSVLDKHRSDGHLTSRGGVPGQIQGITHPVLIGPPGPIAYSHSMVPGGLPVMS